MTRWLLAIVAALAVIGAGWVVFLNGAPAVVRLTPSRTVEAPLAAILLGAFALGAATIGIAAAGRAGVRGFRAWRARRHARRGARREAATARVRDLVWHGDYGQARTELLRGEGGVPLEESRVALLAETYLHEGDAAAARTLLERRKVDAGLGPRLLDLLAEAAERSGDLAAAADALERARGAEPESPRLARRLRDVYAAAGRWADAVAVQAQLMLALREPTALAAEQATMRGLRYQAALAEPDARRATRQLVALLREDAAFLPARVSAGDALVRTGRPVLARRTWLRGARRRPAAVLLERIEALDAGRRRPERTTKLFRRLVHRDPGNPTLRLLFARHLVARERLDEAAAVLREIAEPVASAPVTQALWGELYRRQGQHDQASAAFANAVGPTSDAAAFRCGGCARPTAAWEGYCPTCRRWDTARTAAEAVAPTG